MQGLYLLAAVIGLFFIPALIARAKDILVGFSALLAVVLTNRRVAEGQKNRLEIERLKLEVEKLKTERTRNRQDASDQKVQDQLEKAQSLRKPRVLGQRMPPPIVITGDCRRAQVADPLDATDPFLFDQTEDAGEDALLEMGHDCR